MVMWGTHRYAQIYSDINLTMRLVCLPKQSYPMDINNLESEKLFECAYVILTNVLMVVVSANNTKGKPF
jgi:hypothetical protein